MSAQQWGHGFAEGWDAGYMAGKADGESLPDLGTAERLDVLIGVLAEIDDPSDRRRWVVLRMISELNAAHMLNPARAWHERLQARGSSREALAEGESGPGMALGSGRHA